MILQKQWLPHTTPAAYLLLATSNIKPYSILKITLSQALKEFLGKLNVLGFYGSFN